MNEKNGIEDKDEKNENGENGEKDQKEEEGEGEEKDKSIQKENGVESEKEKELANLRLTSCVHNKLSPQNVISLKRISKEAHELLMNDKFYIGYQPKYSVDDVCLQCTIETLEGFFFFFFSGKKLD